jgi:hypothetical protein
MSEKIVHEHWRCDVCDRPMFKAVVQTVTIENSHGVKKLILCPNCLEVILGIKSQDVGQARK